MSITQLSLFSEEPDDDPGFHRIYLSELPPTAELDSPEPDSQFLASVSKHGVIEPIKVYRDRFDRLQVIDGNRRIKAARYTQKTTILAVIMSEAASSFAPVLSLISNHLRSQNPLAEMEALRRLRDAFTPEEIQKATGLSRTQQAKILELELLPEDFKDAIRAGQMTVNTGRNVLKLDRDRQNQLINLLQEKGRLTAKDVAALKRAKAAELSQDLPDSMFEPEQTTLPLPRTTYSSAEVTHAIHALQQKYPDSAAALGELQALLGTA